MESAIHARRVWSCVAVIVCVGMLVGQVMGQQPQPIAIVHVATVDVERGIIATDMTVVLEAGRIKEVFKSGSKRLPSRARVVNARGKYLIPGLWDMHVHIQDMAGGRHTSINPLEAPLPNSIRGLVVNGFRQHDLLHHAAAPPLFAGLEILSNVPVGSLFTSVYAGLVFDAQLYGQLPGLC